jgi:hypothetical protein
VPHSIAVCAIPWNNVSRPTALLYENQKA